MIPALYRIFSIIVVGLAIALGLVIGTLNSEVASVDLLWIQLDWPLGLIILSSAAAGLFFGLLLSWLFGILPLRARLRKAAIPDNRSPGALKISND